jgi:hypothetical protein
MFTTSGLLIYVVVGLVWLTFVMIRRVAWLIIVLVSAASWAITYSPRRRAPQLTLPGGSAVLRRAVSCRRWPAGLRGRRPGFALS